MMKKVWLMLTLILILAILFSGSVQADPGPETGQTEILTTFFDSWTESGVQTETDVAPLPSADPEKKAYLTFDDGPDPVWSSQVLAVLRKYQVHATFFMIGRNASTFQDTILQIASDGNTLANHSYNHSDLTTLDFQNFSLEVLDTEQSIRNALRDHPELLSQVTKCLRPPYGKSNETVYAYAMRMGYSISMWNLDTRDWAGTDPEDVLADFSKKLQPDRVILFHDGGKERQNTVESLDLVLHELIMQSYEILPYCTEAGQAVIGG
jgi:peptidoglycan/xylan/chitin deacetylase (PgdA/CDA1 family)